jgi:hypothetical protein
MVHRYAAKCTITYRTWYRVGRTFQLPALPVKFPSVAVRSRMTTVCDPSAYRQETCIVTRHRASRAHDDCCIVKDDGSTTTSTNTSQRMTGGRSVAGKGRSRIVHGGRGCGNKRGFIRLVNGNLQVLFVVVVVITSCMLMSLSLSVKLDLSDNPGLSSTLPEFMRSSHSPILEILKLANVSLDRKDFEALPSWNEVVQRLGEEPRIIGLETCQTYRETVPLERRQVAPAGMFSTGTNLLQHLLKANCQVAGRKRRGFVGWQVNWGKHQSPRFRHVNYVHPNIGNNSDVFPVVMVRDPWTWLQTMCRVRYSAHWFHGT